MYNGHKVWFENYYEAHITLPIIHEFGVFYSNRRISSVDYMIEVIKGNIVNGYDTGWRASRGTL